MNAFMCELTSKTICPADHPRLQPLVTGAYATVGDVPSRHRAARLVISESALFEDKRSTRSKPNSTMAVALTARQFASPHSAPCVRAAVGPIDAATIGERP